MRAFAAAGASEMEAIVSATMGSAALGIEDVVGSVKTGKVAELAVLDANPLDDMANVAQERMVMVVSSGRIVYHRGL
jgi:imidazolonepropionase-like amidohydrolase